MTWVATGHTVHKGLRCDQLINTLGAYLLTGQCCLTRVVAVIGAQAGHQCRQSGACEQGVTQKLTTLHDDYGLELKAIILCNKNYICMKYRAISDHMLAYFTL